MQFKIDQKPQVADRLNNLYNWLMKNWDESTPIAITAKPYKSNRSLEQNNLYHQWLSDLVDFYEKKGAIFPDGRQKKIEAMKAITKKLFLGTEDIIVNRTVIEGQLKSTSELSVGEMFFFMCQVQDWAEAQGIYLTADANSEFMRHKREQCE